MKKLILILCLFIFAKMIAQSKSDFELVKLYEKFKTEEKTGDFYSIEDSLWNDFILLFEKTITSEDFDKIDNLKKKKDEFEQFSIIETENKQFTMYCISKYYNNN